LSSGSLSRILVIGREVGPLVQQIKEFNSEIEIGAVDILGNLETRKYSNWTFSVENQKEDTQLGRVKPRSIEEYLLELGFVMLEEISFDQVILLTPFQRKPEFIKSLLNEVEIPSINLPTIEYTHNDWQFTKTILEEGIVETTDIVFFSQDNLIQNKNPGIYITKNNKFLLPSDYNNSESITRSKKGFFVPANEIHCGAFYSAKNHLSFLGLQTLCAPIGHEYFPNELERNSYKPFESSKQREVKKIRSLLSKVIEKLNLFGFLTLFFTFQDEKIIPFSCYSLPDENIDLWLSKIHNHVTHLLINPSKSGAKPNIQNQWGFKTPFYYKYSLVVPKIPFQLAVQRNIPGVRSHPEYPICALVKTSNDDLSLNETQKVKEQELRDIFSKF
jgi:hypothetical protein